MMPSLTDQTPYDLRCEWGAEGIAALAPHADAIVIVDVLSFTTCVSAATERGAVVFPYRFRDATAEAYAASLGATLAVHRGQETDAQPFSLSPLSLATARAGTWLVLPSPNGSTLAACAAGYGVPVLAGCLRNAAATARLAASFGRRIAVIAAGERWGISAGTLRPAVEDLVGAGAILFALEAAVPGAIPSPEAVAAMATRLAAGEGNDLLTFLAGCASGRELADSGFAADVAFAASFNASDTAALLVDGAFVARQG